MEGGGGWKCLFAPGTKKTILAELEHRSPVRLSWLFTQKVSGHVKARTYRRHHIQGMWSVLLWRIVFRGTALAGIIDPLSRLE